MLVDDPVAGLARGPRVDAERGDAEVMPDGPERLAPVVDLVDLFDSRNGVVAHGSIVSRPSQAARAPRPTGGRGGGPGQGEAPPPPRAGGFFIGEVAAKGNRRWRGGGVGAERVEGRERGGAPPTPRPGRGGIAPPLALDTLDQRRLT